MTIEEDLSKMPSKLRKQYNQEIRIEGKAAILKQTTDGGGAVEVNVSDLIHWMIQVGKMAACEEHGWSYQLSKEE